ncbi:hypothetical protein [Methanococcoides sp. AM1]|uniref:hypothetical protein n=1 Tax=Methanococcoides sp. AM1 TaxID=1201011 RepID=UPI0010845C6E|nr:hypothetical protein [Methanococcoides sp. AM1]
MENDKFIVKYMLLVTIVMLILSSIGAASPATVEVFEDWNVTFDGGFSDHAWSVQQTSDGGYIIAGGTDYDVDSDFWLIKTNSTGAEDWNMTFDSGSDDYAYSVQQTSDGDYIVAGDTYGFNYDFWLVKVKENHAPVLSIGDKNIYEGSLLPFPISLYPQLSMRGNRYLGKQILRNLKSNVGQI